MVRVQFFIPSYRGLLLLEKFSVGSELFGRFCLLDLILEEKKNREWFCLSGSRRFNFLVGRQMWEKPSHGFVWIRIVSLGQNFGVGIPRLRQVLMRIWIVYISGFFYIEGANYWLFEVLLPICCRILLEVGRKKRPVRAGNRFYLDPGCTVHLDQATDEKKQYHGFCRIWIVRPDQRWKK